MADHSKMKLGKKPNPFLAAMPRLSQHLNLLKSRKPDRLVDYTNGITDWGMMGNDTIGLCVEASAAHAAQVWTQGNTTPYTGMLTPATKDVVTLYSQLTGYVPGDQSTDNGTIPNDMFKLWAATPLFGCKMLACASVALENWLNLMFAISLFGGVFYSWELPVSAQTQDVWDVVPDDGGVWGGHETFGCAYDDVEETISVISWGKIIPVTQEFWVKYCVEQHVVLSDIGTGMLSRGPGGLDIEALKAEMAELTN